MATFVSQPSLLGTENSGSRGSGGGAGGGAAGAGGSGGSGGCDAGDCEKDPADYDGALVGEDPAGQRGHGATSVDANNGSRSEQFTERISFECNLCVMKEQELRMEEPEAARAPRSVGFLISQLGFFSSRRFTQALEPLGIGPRDFLLLRFVDASDGQSQHAPAERLAIPPSRMVALVDRLEEMGLIERRPDPDDRRVRGL